MRLTGGRAEAGGEGGFYTVRRANSAGEGKGVGGLGSRMSFCALLDGRPKQRLDFVLVPFVFIHYYYQYCLLLTSGYFSYDDFIDTFDIP